MTIRPQLLSAFMFGDLFSTLFLKISHQLSLLILILQHFLFFSIPDKGNKKYSNSYVLQTKYGKKYKKIAIFHDFMAKFGV